MGDEVGELANPLLSGPGFDEGVATISGAIGFSDGVLTTTDVCSVVGVVAAPCVSFGI